jgi:hypothetical protein
MDEYQNKLIELQKTLVTVKSERNIVNNRYAKTIEERVNDIILPKLGKEASID